MRMRQTVLVAAAAVMFAPLPLFATSKPNVILIMADDLGYGDSTIYNSESRIPTPHIDQLAKEGLRFTDAHSAGATCTPFRYGLLTGINPARTGVRNILLKNGKPVIEEDETTIATLLKDHGYHTAMVGKWHLGFRMDMSGKRPAFDFTKPLTGGPLDRGFDEFFGIHSSPHAPWLPTEAFVGKSGAGVYGDFVMQLDSEVGRVCEVLKETGLERNTLLIFTSDNGPGPPAVKLTAEHGHRAAGPLRGSKAMPYEGGHRVPFILKWPARIQTPGVSDTTLNHTDMFAVLAELLAVESEKAYPGSAPDSRSFLALLDEPGRRQPRSAMVNTYDCIRDGDWKLVARKRNARTKAKGVSDFELFNLADNISEEKNLAPLNPERAKRLFDEYKAFIAERKLK